MRIDKKARIYISGHKGMVGTAMLKLLKERGYQNLIFKTSKELDLRQQSKVDSFMQKEKPEYVFLFAAKVGGIKANIDFPAEFLYDNIMIEANVIHASCKYKVKKLLFLGSSCVYPRDCPQPMKEEYLLTGRPEPTNEGFALAKITGLKLCEYYNKQFNTNFICLIPPNLYGPNDNFDLETSHVVSAFIRKFHEAKINRKPVVTVWGTGLPRREFLYINDLVDACIYLMDNYEGSEIINVGVGEDISIRELAILIKNIVGYNGELKLDPSKPDGMLRKLLDVKKINSLGWKAKISLPGGIKTTYQWCRENSVF